MPKKTFSVLLISSFLIACSSLSIKTEPDIDLNELVVTERPSRTPQATATPFPSIPAPKPKNTVTPESVKVESSLIDEIDFMEAGDVDIDPKDFEEIDAFWAETPYGLQTFSPCPSELNNIPEVKCAIIIVPENPLLSEPEDRKIAIQIAVLEKFNQTSAADPLFYIAGGPGGQAVSYIGSNYSNYYERLRQDRDVIVFDPRGNGRSFPSMDCPELKTVYGLALQAGTTEERKLELLLESLDSCQFTLKVGERADVTQYTSRNIANDITLIMEALNYEKADLLGVSYGTRIAQVTAALYPEKIDQLVLDSAVPVPSLYLDEAAERTDWAINHLFESCQIDPVCQENYPDIETVFTETKAHFDENPIHIDIPASYGLPAYQSTLTGDTLSLAILKAMNNPALRPYTIQGIADLSRDNYRLFQLSKNDLIALVGGLSLGSYVSTECAEQIMPSKISDVGAFDAELFESEQLLFLTLLGDSAIEGLQKICEAWGVETAEPEIDLSQVKSDILILSGAFDTLTPPLYGYQVEASYPNATHFVFPDMGHAILGRAETSCPISMTLAFLDKEQILSDCIEEEHQFSFFDPTSAPYVSIDNVELIEVPNLGAKAIRPTGWFDVGSNNFYRSNGYDQTSILIQAAQVSPAEWVDFLAENYQAVGMTNYPEPKTGEVESTFTGWTFYETMDKGNQVTMAFYPMNNITVLVLVAGFPEEHDRLKEALLWPVITDLIFNLE